jgi:hypothetical protein
MRCADHEAIEAGGCSASHPGTEAEAGTELVQFSPSTGTALMADEAVDGGVTGLS